MKQLKIGIVGCRGLSTLLGFNSIPDCRVEAMCDLDDNLLKIESEKNGFPHTYRVYEDMLMSDIDAVVVSTPMQSHTEYAMMALEAGKHVLSEVTAGVTMDELFWLCEAVEQSGKTYMYAENYCYMPYVQQIRQMVRAGMFGDVYYCEGEYLHDVKELTRYNYGLHQSGRSSWRRYWQLGKRGCFYPTHSLGPVMQWFEGERIKQVASFGSGHHVGAEQGLRQDDTSVTMCQMESGKLARIRVDCMSPRPHNMTYYQLQGTRGVFETPRGFGDQLKICLTKDSANYGEAKWESLDNYSSYLPERYRAATSEQNAAGHGGGDFFLVQDFVDAIRTGQKPDIDVYQACEWTAVGLLSELSVQNGGRTMDMPNFRKNMPWEEQVIRL